MPKRGPVVPAAPGRVGGGAKQTKKKKRAIASAADAAAHPVEEQVVSGDDVDSAAQAHDADGGNDGGLLRLSMGGSWCAESGREILASADRSDKPARFVSWMLAPLSAAEFERDVRERQPCHLTGAEIAPR